MFNRVIWLVLISVCVPLYANAESGGLPEEVAALTARVTQLESQVEALLTQLDTHSAVAAAHHVPESIAVPILEDLLDGVSRGTDAFGYDTLRFTGMNVQIVNGEGETDSTNGMGNLIIGYNPLRGNSECPDGLDCDRRTGSHTLVIGRQHNYTSWGGVVAGYYNETSAPFASVSGGYSNLASGAYSSVSGGTYNIASGDFASVSGGQDNIASGESASVSGGVVNIADGDAASISSGRTNTASGESASVSGGEWNTASGKHSSVSGGNGKTAASYSCWTGGSHTDC